MENGLETFAVDMEFKYGPMVLNMRGNGRMGRLMERVNITKFRKVYSCRW